MTEAIIQIQDLEKRFRSKNTEVYALQGINLTIRKGDIFGIIGKSGAGKSTLVRCINMLERPTGGSVMFEGRDMCRLGSRDLQIARRSMGMIFQQFNLLMQRTAEENICFPLELAGVKKDAARERARELLELVNLSDRAQSYPSQLSGGQKQRVAIARALATNPKILLCDEATSALDPATTESILSLIKDINRRLGITAIIITHEMSVIEKICNQVAIISHGRIAETGSVEEVFFHPQTEEARQLVIPEALQDMPHSRLYRIIFNGRSSFEPVISNLVLECGLPSTSCLPTRATSADGIRPDGAATSGQRRGRPAYPRLCRLQGTDAGGNEECLIRLPSKCCLKASWTRCT
ncbi:MAG: methionine ABC transporter ATP-binding protein [Bilophila wadsworthia]